MYLSHPLLNQYLNSLITYFSKWRKLASSIFRLAPSIILYVLCIRSCLTCASPNCKLRPRVILVSYRFRQISALGSAQVSLEGLQSKSYTEWLGYNLWQNSLTNRQKHSRFELVNLYINCIKRTPRWIPKTDYKKCAWTFELAGDS